MKIITLTNDETKVVETFFRHAVVIARDERLKKAITSILEAIDVADEYEDEGRESNFDLTAQF